MVETTNLPAEEIAQKAIHIAADLCVFTNHNVIVEEIGGGLVEQ
jgi:ATP-dependent HslUV protease subunit HslV